MNDVHVPGPRFDVFSLFPMMFHGPLSESIVKRAVERERVSIHVHDIRNWTTDRHRTADDTPYGGGAGMVMRAEPIVQGVEQTLGDELASARVLVMAASGRPFTQRLASDLAAARRVVLICGHYEGIDERVMLVLNTEPISVGDAVLTGGELPAMVVIDAVTRLVPGVIETDSINQESHSEGLLEYPHYTRPAVFREERVPEILLSGHHANIHRWRREQAIIRTARYRPDMLRATLSGGELPISERELALRELATWDNASHNERESPPTTSESGDEPATSH